ncbi:hypothetical protein RO3G_03461 [Rhizopus delemar RA 99-880]|uniref:Uncharacterized protein n=1 Tax=Rhizopus delemar (strain RA 99-880 / ATCC MYA-4621 / FGSC 9543 / NRRL 43880) TaxID=246409 RepID=I1BRC6_RHIO9|nr:hypothetical protein RO3G_03461 [Rhizopus delemar RA 99-880]|eukprot:EIE78756.1 hypothetical protein RO3G_03461 [Rhizopus delemar RA 99-880]
MKLKLKRRKKAGLKWKYQKKNIYCLSYFMSEHYISEEENNRDECSSEKKRETCVEITCHSKPKGYLTWFYSKECQ